MKNSSEYTNNKNRNRNDSNASTSSNRSISNKGVDDVLEIQKGNIQRKYQFKKRKLRIKNSS